jgi:hypothetical protein
MLPTSTPRIVPKQLYKPHRTRANDDSAGRPDHAPFRIGLTSSTDPNVSEPREDGTPKLHRAFIFIVSC